ncbi:MAG: AIR synthase related protein, partial [Candidatus Aerophobetes bacterium]|nr:AIR synthase related protein [Candidatus Aerophobetes bacterium]
MNEKKLTYKRAGVDIKKGEKFSRWIKKRVPSLTSSSVLSKVGSFSGLYPLDKEKGRGLVLAATTDGVGTKLRIAQQANKHNSIGIDLVAMSVNDLLAEGAKPLFFLDYISTSKLSLSRGKQIISGIIEGCKRAGCALLGGETAEMPSFYKEGDYDVA